MDDRTPKRSAAVYAVTGLMLVFAVAFGAFFAVWCFTLRFLFSDGGWWAFLLLVFSGLIAWRAFDAARDAWEGLPGAPPAAIGVVLLVQLLVVLVQLESILRGIPAGLSLGSTILRGFGQIRLWMLAPHAIAVLLIAGIFWSSPRFDRHYLETELVYETEPALPPDDEDPDELYLGGA